jgi:nucleoside-diphosphate-sugar epimerase
VAHYLLTGAAGFVASRVGELLLQDGHTVLGIDNLNDAYDVRMKHYRLDRLRAHDGFSFQKMDISFREHVMEMADQLRACDGVINLAARAGVRASVRDPWLYVDTNMSGTLNLLELCRRNQIPKFILASTSSIYGADPPLPTPEDAETSQPLQPYAASKKGAEAMCHAYHHLYEIDVTIFRYFTVYGPAGRPDMVMFRFNQWIREHRPVFVRGEGKQSRGFTYVDDIARGTIMGLTPVGYEIFNLGGHEVVDLLRLVELFEGLIGKKARLEHLPRHRADMDRNWADTSKVESKLGWQPSISLEEGMAKMVEWYERERDWAKDVDTEI